MPRRSPYVFTSEDGLPIKKWQLDWMVKKFQRTFPTEKKWCLHSFRHSFAQNFRRAGGQMYELQALMGHRNILVTINQYGQLNAADIENPSPYSF
jgi:site-specific recombinase XerD